jgi:hypothetical protein
MQQDAKRGNPGYSVLILAPWREFSSDVLGVNFFSARLLQKKTASRNGRRSEAFSQFSPENPIN